MTHRSKLVVPRWIKLFNQENWPVSHFTLHSLSDWRVSDSSPLAYLRECTCELDIGAFLHCKIYFVGLAYGNAKAGE